MLKDLINPTNFNVLVGKLGDVLVKALDQPLDTPLIGEGFGLCGLFISKQPVVV